MNFSKWTKWQDRKSLTGIKYPGIYAILHSGTNESKKEFTWREDIIYIGMTNSKAGLKGRLQQFDNTINPKIRTGHGGADRVSYKYRDYDDLVNHLYVSIIYIDCNVNSEKPIDLRAMGEVAKLEYVCFAKYVENFGHLPEFNNKKLSPKYSLTVGRNKRIN